MSQDVRAPIDQLCQVQIVPLAISIAKVDLFGIRIAQGSGESVINC